MLKGKLSKNIALTAMLMMPGVAFSMCQNVLFILDDSGSISSTERTDMTASVQALADNIETFNPAANIGVIQYSSVSTGKHYVVESPLTLNPTIINANQPGVQDFLPTSIAEMEGDGLFSGGGAFANTDSVFIFTDAFLGTGFGSWITGTGIPTTGIAATPFPPTTAFTEYSDLSTSLGGIPISMFRVGTNGGSATGVAQGMGILDEGNANFQMTPAQITAFTASLSCATTPTAVPTLSEWMLGLLALLLAMVGFSRRERV